MELVKQAAVKPPKPMMPISARAASVFETIPKNLDERAVCPLCFGCGMSDPDGRGRRPCECRINRLRAQAIARIPERNRKNGLPDLMTLKPMIPPDHRDQTETAKRRIVEWQAKIIAYVQQNPFVNLNLCGINKIGKSQIAYAMYLHAFEHHRPARAFKMAELLADYHKAAKLSFDDSLENAYGNRFAPRLTADELDADNVKYTVLIDEFHNVIPSFTPAQIRTTFEILDAIKGRGHQLILLSNYPFKWLGEAMKSLKQRKDHGEPVVYQADAIISRIAEDAVTEELFF